MNNAEAENMVLDLFPGSKVETAYRSKHRNGWTAHSWTLEPKHSPRQDGN